MRMGPAAPSGSKLREAGTQSELQGGRWECQRRPYLDRRGGDADIVGAADSHIRAGMTAAAQHLAKLHSQDEAQHKMSSHHWVKCDATVKL